MDKVRVTTASLAVLVVPLFAISAAAIIAAANSLDESSHVFASLREPAQVQVLATYDPASLENRFLSAPKAIQSPDIIAQLTVMYGTRATMKADRLPAPPTEPAAPMLASN